MDRFKSISPTFYFVFAMAVILLAAYLITLIFLQTGDETVKTLLIACVGAFLGIAQGKADQRIEATDSTIVTKG